jgi:nucleoid-associated protein YgaU
MKMKNIRTLALSLGMIGLAFVLFFVAAQPAYAQQTETKDQWMQDMKAAQDQNKQLTDQSAALDKDIADANAKLATADADQKACEDALFAILGVTRDQWDQFQKDLAQMEARVAQLQGMSDDQIVAARDEIKAMQAKATDMQKSNIAKLPRFASRLDALQNKLAALLKAGQSKEHTYTVGTWAKNRDCLWNIAKKPDIYANAWMWPKIYVGNRDQIKDPDIIKPKMVLRIPEAGPMDAKEKSAAKKYYHRKSAGTN